MCIRDRCWPRRLGGRASDRGPARGTARWRAHCGQERFLRGLLRSHEAHMIGDISAERARVFGRWNRDAICERKERCQSNTVERRGILEDRPLRRGEEEIVALDGIAVEKVVSAFVEHLICLLYTSDAA